MYGSKIDNLKVLQERGVNVPEFEIVSFSEVIDDAAAFSEYYRAQLKKNSKIASDNITNYLREHIVVNFDQSITASSFAIRSSSNLEDGAKDSFAGQFKSFMRVSPARVKSKIKECFLSLASENVISYLKWKQINTKWG